MEDLNKIFSELETCSKEELSSNLTKLKNQVDSIFKTQRSNFTKLNQIGTALSAESNLNVLLELIVTAAMDFTNADGGTLYRTTDDDKHLKFEILRTASLDFKMGGTTGKDIPFYPIKLFPDGQPNHQQVAAYVALTGETVNIPDVYEVSGFDFQGTKGFDQKTGYRSKSMLVIPLKNHENEIIGVLQLLNAQDQKNEIIAFSKETQKIIESLASQAAIALTNTQLIKGLNDLLEAFIKVIAGAIDEKSPYTGGHIRRVAEVTLMIAEAIHKTKEGRFAKVKFSPENMHELKVAGWLHDIGKITTPEYVVDKATKLETIYDRIHTVVTRFEILKRDVQIEFLEQKAKLLAEGKANEAQVLEAELQSKISEIEDDCNFVKQVNVGGEFLSDDKVERVETIAKKYKVTVDGEHQNFLSENEVYNLSIRKGTLTAEERNVINHHIVVTIDMLESLPYPKKLRNVPEFAGGHHETLIGTGYPKGLTEDELSLEAKIMAVADIFEALTAQDRPYKDGKKMSEAMRILGFFVKDRHIDGDILKAFVESGYCAEYAKNELHPNQLDSFEFEGKTYDYTVYKEHAQKCFDEKKKQIEQKIKEKTVTTY